MGKGTAIRRALWTTVLIMQVLLYAQAFPLLLARVTRNHLPGNEVVNVVGYDLIGIGAWLMFLLFMEQRSLRGSKWLDYTIMGLFALLTGIIILTNLTAGS